MTASVPVLVDTDIGSDIDDAICLSYLLAQPRCELLGITTVSGQPKVRASLVDALCRAAGRSHIPVHAGTEAALLSATTPQPDVPQAAVLDRFDHTPAKNFEPNTAVAFLHQTIMSRPGEVILLAIGPLTNIALLFATHPDVPAAMRALVVMAGSFSNRGFSHRVAGAGPYEWNACCDPYAAGAVYGTPVADHVSIGVDVTRKCEMEPAAFIVGVETLGGSWPVVVAMAGTRDSVRTIVFHDPLAAVSIFRPDVCTWARGRVTVELASRRFRGVTSFDRGEDGSPHTIATDVDTDVFFGELFQVCSAARR